MLLNELTISNYKSFYEETKMQFGPGFNVLLGANSSGKTTVLETIRFLDFPDVRHRSLANIVEIDTPWDEAPRVTARLDIALTQLQRMVSGRGLTVILNDATGNLIGNKSEMEEYWRKSPFSIEFIRHPGKAAGCCFFPLGRRSAERRSNSPIAQWRGHLDQNGIEYPSSGSFIIGNDVLDDVDELANIVHQRVYRFSAERVVRAVCGPGHPELQPDASNLAFCINHLQTSDNLTFDLLNSYLHRIFPNIHNISAVPRVDGQFELRVYTLPREARRPDLAVPMDRVGTGVSNAVAMLYVVLTAHSPRIFLLEEPNSYLHPRALRELLAILTEAGAKHQFFITTHSSDVLRSVAANSVTLLENDGIKTTVRQTQSKDLRTFQAGLLDLGIRLTDLHGCDRVLWVEGETEEAIFPLLLAHFFPELAQGIATLRLHATGDFEARKIRPGKVAEIYRRLSQATFLAPPMVAITLDREGKNQSQVDSLVRECDGMVYLLPKPMVEDYLLDAEAIAEVLYAEYQVKLDLHLMAERMEQAKINPDNRLLPRHPTDLTPHAAKVLQTLFSDLGGLGAEYDKATHGPMLAQWLLNHRPTAFDELQDWFRRFI